MSSNCIKVKLEKEGWRRTKICGETEVRFRETALLGCSSVSAKSQESFYSAVTKKDLLVGSD